MFCSAYAFHLNGTEAYLQISPNVERRSAGATGCVMLKRPEIRARVNELLDAKRAAFEVDPAVILHNIQSAANADVADFMDDLGEIDLLLIKTAPPEKRRAIESIEVTYDARGGKKVKLKMKDGLRANELLGKNQKLWTDKTEVSGPGGGDVSIKVTFKEPEKK